VWSKLFDDFVEKKKQRKNIFSQMIVCLFKLIMREVRLFFGIERNDDKKRPVQQPCDKPYAQKIILEPGRALGKSSYLIFAPYDEQSKTPAKENHVKISKEQLSKLTKDIKQKEKWPQELPSMVAPMVKELLKSSAKWPHDGQKGCLDISVSTYLEGGKVKCEFVKYECKRKGYKNVWEEKDKWKATVQVKPDDLVPVGMLEKIDLDESGIARRLEKDLAHILTPLLESKLRSYEEKEPEG